MCGINGIISFGSGIENGKELVAGMNNAISHRGPDDHGYWSDDERKIHFGHLRLSIIDLSPAGHQPMIAANGNVIIFNGEIYNYKELKIKYFSDYQFKGDSDTEVLLALYDKFGENCLNYLNGMFAFAIWDFSKKQLFIARDRVGKKPFYYSMQDGKFSFSSEIKGLLRLPWMKRKLDENAMYHFLTFNLLAPPQTMFDGIDKLEPGCKLTIDSKGVISKKEYWEVNYSAETEKLSEEESQIKVEKALERAIELRMVADVPVGAFLSGGVDSSAVVAYMSKLTSKPVNTFSIGFEGQQEYDERFYANKVSKLFKTNHSDIVVTSDDIESFLPEVVNIFDEPMADATCIPIYFLSQKARESGSIVVLTGDGSDELFAGYRNWKKFIQLFPWYNQYSKLPDFVKQGVLKGAGIFASDSAYEILSRSARGQDMFWGGAKSFKESTKTKFLSEEYLERLGVNDSYSVIQRYKERFEMIKAHSNRKFEYADWMCYLGVKFMVPNYYLYRMDHLGMANSIEIRSPFLDYEFVNTALSISSKYKLSNEEPKYILKKALEKVLPQEILYRKKMGFCVPLKEWAGDLMIDYIEKNLRSFCNDHPQFKYDELNSLLKQLKAGDESTVNRLWTLYFLIAWFKKWLD
ncbi:MAG: asparagine synthase (glutamine-hydrolyzing) [Bacteroidota bacterium]